MAAGVQAMDCVMYGGGTAGGDPAAAYDRSVTQWTTSTPRGGFPATS